MNNSSHQTIQSLVNLKRASRRAPLAVLCLGVVGLGVALLTPKAEASQTPLAGTIKTCKATWYGAQGEIPEGWPTASGEPFHRMALKAAHNSFPFGTKVKVTYQGKSVTVTVNDRGGFKDPICLDLTYGAFTKIANTDLGVISVQYQVL